MGGVQPRLETWGTQMELATLICANTRKRAIEIALERSLPQSAEQNELRYNSTGANLQWAYVGDMKSLFGRPEKSLIIFDDSARKLSAWNQIIDYVAARDFRCEWVGQWLPAKAVNPRAKQFVDRLRELGVCAVCKQPVLTVTLYEGPGLLHFIHGQGRECRVAIDMSNLSGALETLTKAVKQAAFDKVVTALPDLIRAQQRVSGESRREWLGPGLYDGPPSPEAYPVERARLEEEKRRWSKEIIDRALLNQLQQAEIVAKMELDRKTYDRLVNQTVTPPAVIDPPKPVLPVVVSRTTVRRVKFD